MWATDKNSFLFLFQHRWREPELASKSVTWTSRIPTTKKSNVTDNLRPLVSNRPLRLLSVHHLKLRQVPILIWTSKTIRKAKLLKICLWRSRPVPKLRPSKIKLSCPIITSLSSLHSNLSILPRDRPLTFWWECFQEGGDLMLRLYCKGKFPGFSLVGVVVSKIIFQKF